jgi:hypothetical protein
MNTSNWTFGVEHEWGDIDTRKPLPKGFGWDKRDITIVNSNGIANDPSGKLYPFGREINTPPTDSIHGQLDCLAKLKHLFPEAVVNYRSNLHCHIRVPGLKDDLKMLKQIQAYIHFNMKRVLEYIEPIPRPLRVEWKSSAEYEGALRRWRRRRVSHHTLLTPKRIDFQQQAKTLKSFFEREVPQSKTGKPLWHCQPRVCVNLRQLMETDTIEFRHFPGTLRLTELTTCLQWCDNFLAFAIQGLNIEKLLDGYSPEAFPKFPLYNHEQERRYRATVHDGTVSKEQIAKNIQLILEGKFK